MDCTEEVAILERRRALTEWSSKGLLALSRRLGWARKQRSMASASRSGTNDCFAIALSHRPRETAREAIEVLAILGAATLWMAVLADAGASVIVVGNALRLLRAR